MPRTIKLEELNNNPELRKNIVEEIKKGKIFIYPTDTIYGIGCNALLSDCVEKIKQIKERDREKPLSIIVPSIAWIRENLIVGEEDRWAIEKYLPGAYTLLLKKKNNDFLSWVSANERIGVRIPDSEFSLLVKESGVPFITTSVNLSGEKFAIYLNEVSEDIINKVDYVIKTNIGLTGKPSTLVIDGKEIKRD